MTKAIYSVLTSFLTIIFLTSFTAHASSNAVTSELYRNIGAIFLQNERGQEQGKGKKKDKEHKDYKKDKNDKWEKDEKERILPFTALRVPKGHLPPPGECKIWFPGKPPGHQPPPQSCSSALRDAPLGAWVISHDGENYKVNIFNRKKRNVVDEVRFYKVQ